MTRAMTVPITPLTATKDGGLIRITTPGVDRDRDRVMPLGGRTEAYLRNPVVQWGHQYQEPWQTVGKALELTTSPEGIDALFELREPASASDPQHIVRQLWADGLINAASIGFRPLAVEPNEFGGLDFTSWELLEFSLVPIPANPEALRRALDAHPLAAKAYLKRGRVLSRANEDRIRQIASLAQEILGQLGDELDDDPKERGVSPAPVAPAPIAPDLTALTNALAGLRRAFRTE